ncbi:hypothetical protein IMG5_100750, partial [Ichthyophthirius multifiliis]
IKQKVHRKVNNYMDVQYQEEYEQPQTYKKQNVKTLFGEELSIKSNYKFQQIVNEKDTRSYLISNFEDLQNKLRSLEGDFTGLEKSFYHLIIKTENGKDYQNRLLAILQKKIDEFMDKLDKNAINNFDPSSLEDDYEFQTFKNLLKQGVNEISNKLTEFFLNRNNSQAYDFEVFKCLENILSLNNFIKSDFSNVVSKSMLDYNKILYHICVKDPNEAVNFADFIHLDIPSLQTQNTVIVYKKSMISNKFHDIVNEKIFQCTKIDYVQLIKSVFIRERRKVFQNIHNYIIKQGKVFPEFDQSEQNKKLTEKMNLIKQEFLQLKNHEFFMDVLSGRLDTQALDSCEKKILFQIEKYFLKVNELFKEIKNALKDIIEYKEFENQFIQEKYQNILSNKIHLEDEDKREFAKNNLGEYTLILFQKLEDALMKDNQQFQELDLEDKLHKQMQKNKQNYHLDKTANNFLLDIKIRANVKKFIRKLKENAKLTDNKIGLKIKELNDQKAELEKKIKEEEQKQQDMKQNQEKLTEQIDKLHQQREKKNQIQQEIKRLLDIQEKVRNLNFEKEKQEKIIQKEEKMLFAILKEGEKHKSITEKLKNNKLENQQRILIKKQQNKLQEIQTQIQAFQESADKKLVFKNQLTQKQEKKVYQQEELRKRAEEDQRYQDEQLRRRQDEFKKRQELEKKIKEEEDRKKSEFQSKLIEGIKSKKDEERLKEEEERQRNSLAGKLVDEIKNRKDMEYQLRKEQEEKSKGGFASKLQGGIKEKKIEEEHKQKSMLESIKDKQREEERKLKEEQERQKKLREEQEKIKQQKAIEEKKKKEEEYNRKLQEIKEKEEKEKQERKLQKQNKIRVAKKLQQEEKQKKFKKKKRKNGRQEKKEEEEKKKTIGRRQKEKRRRRKKRKQQEEDKKKKEDEERRKQQQEEEEKKRKQQEEDKKKKEEEEMKKQQQLDDEKKKKEEEERKKKQQLDDEKKKKEEEEKKRRQQEEDKKKKEDEERRKQQQEEEEKKKKDDEEKKKQQLETQNKSKKQKQYSIQQQLYRI